MENSFYLIRNDIQNNTREELLESLPNKISEELKQCQYMNSPGKDILMMELLDAYMKRVNIRNREFNNPDYVTEYVRSFKKIPDNLSVYMWSISENGPLYKVELTWVIKNFSLLWNKNTKYNLSFISQSGKVGMLLFTENVEITPGYSETIYRIKKWGLI